MSQEEAETMVTQFPLLQAGADILGETTTAAPSLDSLLGGSDTPSEESPEE